MSVSSSPSDRLAAGRVAVRWTARLAGLVLVVLLALPGCGGPNYERMGDTAAALGNWRDAEANYRLAVQQEPARGDLQTKHEDAKARALAAARRRAVALRDSGNPDGALDEVDYALTLAPDDAELISMRATLARDVALAKLAAARQLATAGNVDEAEVRVNEARDLTDDPAVQEEITATMAFIGLQRAEKSLADAAAAFAREEFADAAMHAWSAKQASSDADIRRRAEEQIQQIAAPAADKAMALAGEGKYAQAKELAELAAGIDPQYQSLAESIGTVHDEQKKARFDALVAEARAALARQDWATADAKFIEALQNGTDPEVVAQADYARHAVAAGVAIGAADWAAATTALQAAIGTGKDVSGWVANELARVTVSTVRIDIAQVLVSPLQEDGRPFTEVDATDADAATALAATRDALAAIAATIDAANPPADALAELATLADALAEEFRPLLRLRLTLADGTVLESTIEWTGVYMAAPDCWVAVEANRADPRPVKVEVLADAGLGADPWLVGTVEVPLGELVGAGAVRLQQGQRVLMLRLTATPAAEATAPGTMSPNLADTE